MEAIHRSARTRTRALVLVLLTAALASIPPGATSPLLLEEGPEPVATEPLFDDSHGDHLSAHVRTENPNGFPSLLLAVEDLDGDLIAYIFTLNNDLWASEGTLAGTSEAVLITEDMGTTWKRLDIWVHGATYDVAVNLEAWTTGLETTTLATEMRLRADPSGILEPSQEEVHIDRVRADWGGAQDHTFATPLADRGWSAVVHDGGQSFTGPPEVDRRNGFGYQGAGSVEIRGSGVPGGLAYLQTDVTAFNGAYVAEAAIRPDSVLTPPDHQAVLAGISGPDDDPTVHWAITMGAVAELGGHQLFYQAPDGARSPIGPVWTATAWHTVRATLLEDEGLVQVQIDGSDTALAFTGQDIGSSQRIAIGDIQTGVLPGGHFLADYDDVSVLPFA